MIAMNNPGGYVESIEQGCRAWRRGDDQEGRRWFQQACLLWLEELRGWEQEAATDRDAMLVPAGALPLMDQVLLMLQREDVVGATDVLEYELLPELRRQLADRASRTGRDGDTP
ncbi:hypothetical protein [Paenibacillus daejeonensis]|uniref:hypothetical protein n=1 Tax=Paenibacillus daejeonensis TaxID=135193 RepID=UPI0012F94974|nr:hypothetical protein [Paenibacillus daejeonensis]